MAVSGGGTASGSGDVVAFDLYSDSAVRNGVELREVRGSAVQLLDVPTTIGLTQFNFTA